MKKFKMCGIITILILSFVSASIYAAPTMAADKPISVYIDEDQLDFDVEPLIVNGRVLVPFRAVMESFNAQVDYANGVITTQYEDGEIILKVNSTLVSYQGSYFYTDVPPKVVGGRTVIPLRLISELLGYGVTWDGENRSVLIDSSRPIAFSLPDSHSLAEEIMAFAESPRQQLTAYGQVSTWEEYSKPDDVLFYPAGIAVSVIQLDINQDISFANDIYESEVHSVRIADKYYNRTIDWGGLKTPEFLQVDKAYSRLSETIFLENLAEWDSLNFNSSIYEVTKQDPSQIYLDLLDRDEKVEADVYTFKVLSEDKKLNNSTAYWGVLTDYLFRAWISTGDDPRLIKTQYYHIFLDEEGNPIYRTIEVYFDTQFDFDIPDKLLQ